MFGHKLSSIPNQNYRVESHPTIEQLAEMIDKSRAMFGIRHNYQWEIPKEFKKYTLSLHCKEKGVESEIEWWLHEENVVGTKMLWFHKTKDIAVIYPHLLAAVGAKHPLEETEEDIAKRDREKEKPASLGERLKRSSSSAELVSPPPPPEPETPLAPDAGQASMMRLMSGSLKLRPIAWLLQTAAQSGLTGELTVQGSGNRSVVIQFGLGRPVHAVSANKVGTDAVLELFAWADGQSTFTEGKQPETASVQDSTDEILKQGAKMLENLGFLGKHNMDENSVLSRPPIGLSEEQLEQRLKDGINYGFKVQRSFYRALDGQLSLREVGEQIQLDSARLIGIAVNFLKLGLILTADGRSLREVAPAEVSGVFSTNSQTAQGQSGPQPALKPPPGFFGGGGGGGMSAEMQKPTGETVAPLAVPHEFAAPDVTASGAYQAMPPWTPDKKLDPAPQQNASEKQQALPPASEKEPLLGGIQQVGADREFFDVGVPADLLTFDQSSAKEVFASLTNRQTGALTYPAFQFFLEREFARAFRFSAEFSLLLFCIRLGGEQNATTSVPVLPMSALASATQAVNQVKREVDILGHVGDKSFGLILPGVNSSQSLALVDRIVAELPKLAPKLGGYWPILHFGIAGVPADARDLQSLVRGTQEAMIEAARRNYSRIRVSEMSS